MPSVDPDNWHPVHTYLLGECGVPILENAYLEELPQESLYEYVFFGAGLRPRGRLHRRCGRWRFESRRARSIKHTEAHP